MKKTILLIILLTVVFANPHFTLAVWWNPFSWKMFSSSQNEVKITSQITDNTYPNENKEEYAEYYIKFDNSKVRECPNLDCKVLGYYQKNTKITIIGSQKIEDLNEWVALATTDSGQEGFVSKSLLSEAPVTEEVTKNPLSNPLVFDGKDDKSLLKLIDITISRLESQITYTNFLKKSVGEIKTLAQDRRDSLDDKHFTQLIQVEDKSISKYIEYMQAFDNANSFSDLLLGYVKAYKKEVSSNSKKFDNATYISLIIKFYKDSDKMLESTEDVWDEFVEYNKNVRVERDIVLKTLETTIRNTGETSAFVLPKHIYEPILLKPLSFPNQQTCNVSSIGGGGVDLVVRCY